MDDEIKYCSNSLSSKLNPDLIYDELGGFGKFQLFVYVLICLPLMFIVASNFSYIFIASDMEYRCFVPECEVDAKIFTTEWLQKAIPQSNGKSISKCERYKPVFINETDNSHCPWYFNQSILVQCDKFVYLTQERLLLNEYNLTCENNQWKLTIIGSLGYLAECIALPFIGIIADKYGRRPTLICSIIFMSIIGMLKTFSPNYLTFVVLHFIGAIFGGGAFSLVFVLGSEVVGPNSRGLGAAIITNAVSGAQILLALVAMCISDFRFLLQFIYGLVALVLTFIWFVPESVRWLFSMGKYEKGLKILENVAKMNGTKISTDTLNALTISNQGELLINSTKLMKKTEAYPLRTVMKYNVLRNRLINCCYCYFTNALIYFGLSVYSSILPGVKEMNLLYTGMVELPGNAATHYVLQRYNRKWSLIMSMLICSAACIVSELASEPSVKMVFFLIGKFAVSLSFTILNVYSIELFPTNLRQSMFNTCMTFAGVGNMLAPQMPLLAKFMPTLPLILFGGTSFSSALLILHLPETRNKDMPDTVEEAINI